MNYNVLAYSFYLVIMVFIIGYVGKLFHRNGRHFILALFKDDEAQTDTLNNILLLAYYLFNIGYAFVKLRYWIAIDSIDEVLSSLGSNIGLLIFILASTHYFNMALIYFLAKKANTITY